MSARLTKSAADALAFYSFDGTAVLAPRGWKCNGSSGSGGANVRAYDPSIGLFPNPSGDGYEPRVAVTGWVTSSGTNHPLFLACPWFADADASLKDQGIDCGYTGAPRPVGEQQTRISNSEFTFRDQGGAPGTADPSGGPNPSRGFVLWYPRYADRIKQDAAATATCELPERDTAMCATILGNFKARFRTAVIPLYP